MIVKVYLFTPTEFVTFVYISFLCSREYRGKGKKRSFIEVFVPDKMFVNSDDQ